MTIHVEADLHAYRTLTAIREDGALAGLALNPGTPAEAVSAAAEVADILLCMSVNPGWGGQAFIQSSPDKVAALSEFPPPHVEVDGGVDAETVKSVADAGANLFVAGSAIFGEADPAAAYRRIAEAAGAA